MSERKWTHQTAEKVAQCLADGLGIRVSATVVRRLLGELNYSLKSNKKCLSSGNSPDRDTQFGIIKGLREEFSLAGDPIISVDTKKKELIGLFKNSGQTWCSEAKEVKDHDFRSEAEGLAAPYGIYDVQRNFGVLVVGESADTPEFAVNSILIWWEKHGQYDYPTAKRLLILADSGGSNGARPRVWKKLLQERFADEYSIVITVAHYPAGASKWNPIEHRMFNEISKNWAGEPLVTFNTVVNFARKTTTKTGLRVEAYHDQRIYEKGKKVSDKEMQKIVLIRGDELGKWNYTIQPRISHGAAQSQPVPKPQSTKLQSSPAKTMNATSCHRGSEPRQHKDQPVDRERVENPTNMLSHGSSGASQGGVSVDAASFISSAVDKRQTFNRTKLSSLNWPFNLSRIITGVWMLFSSLSH